MVTELQKRKIHKLMRSIKDAHDNNVGEKETEKRVKELTDYLQQEGIINPFRDDD